jgi:hypothetical protein
MKDDVVSAAVKAAPPIAVTGSQVLFDLTLNEWVAVATLLYIALQAAILLRNEFRGRK